MESEIVVGFTSNPCCFLYACNNPCHLDHHQNVNLENETSAVWCGLAQSCINHEMFPWSRGILHHHKLLQNVQIECCSNQKASEKWANESFWKKCWAKSWLLGNIKMMIRQHGDFPFPKCNSSEETKLAACSLLISQRILNYTSRIIGTDRQTHLEVKFEKYAHVYKLNE